MKKYAGYIGLAGLVFAVLGMVIYSVNALITTASAIFLILGIVLLVLFSVLRFDEIKQGLSSRSAKFGSNAALMIIFTLGILIIVNIIFSKFTYRVDLTAAKQFSLAEQTRKVLKHLDKDVNVIGFFKSGEEFQAKELLTEYSHYSPRFKFEFIDPDKKPGLAKKYGITAYSTIVLECEGKEEKVQKTTEEDITNALIKVTREGVKKICFTTGHGEKDIDDTERSGLSTAKKAIEDENYQVEKILLAEQDSIPEDCTVLVVAGPKSDLFKKEEDMIEKYLKAGGKALFLLDPQSPEGYVSFLKKWGFKIGNDIVVDASGIGQLFGAGPTIPIVSKYENHALTKDFHVMTFYPEARSISKADDAPVGITFNAIAKTSSRSWAETSPLTGGRIAFDSDKDTKGPITIFAVVEKNAENPRQKEDKYDLGNTTVKTRIGVFGDSDFASNSYFKVQGNGDIFMNAISWLAEEEDLISVRPRDPEDRRLNLTAKQSRILLYVGVILLPVLIFATGIFVYTKRK